MSHHKQTEKRKKAPLVFRQCRSDFPSNQKWNDTESESHNREDENVTIFLDSPTLSSINYGELLDALGLASSSSITEVSLSFSGSVSYLGRPFNMSVNGHKPDFQKINVSGNDAISDGAAQYRTIEQFVETNVSDPSKRCPIRKMLVATNGIAAVRCMLTIRRLLNHTFRDDSVIHFTCMTTKDEADSSSEYIKIADSLADAPSGNNKNNYANVDEIVKHAVEQNVDAVWAGWGHASENPELPRRLAEKNIVFIGPPSSAMFSLGDKIASTIIAQTVGIPTIAWSGSGICMENTTRSKGDFVDVPKELLNEACVKTYEEGLKALEAHKIGFPLMIKASEGGGGKGIRKCTKVEDFKSMFYDVSLEVPGSPIFLMKCVENARHIEVQLIADRYENVISVFTRDCSIQRRCQKIIEEAPASIAPRETRKRMQEDAVRIAKFVGYESAGTVEYLYLPDEDKYFFLELNPRLQVEHPCTEMISGISIPAIQLQIAMGLPLHKIQDIRNLYNLPKNGDCELPDEVLTDTTLHAIAARITSEDPDDSFRPSTGKVSELNFRSSQDAWAYFSVSGGGKVHEFADSQFGHLFARGRSRQEAIGNILGALKEMEIKASFKSQVSYLVGLIREPAFTNNIFNTQWLDDRIAKKIRAQCTLPMSDVIAVSAAVIGHSRVTEAFDSFKGAIERGQVLPPNNLTETFIFDLVKDLKTYSVKVTRSAPLSFVILLNEAQTTVTIKLLGNGGLMATHGGNTYPCNLEESPEVYKVLIRNEIITFEKDNDPSVLKSPYTGKFLNYKKENNELVGVDEVFATVESMKLVFNVEVKKAPGRLIHVVNEGDLIFPGSVIGRLVDQKNSEMFRPKPFVGVFPEWTAVNNSTSTDMANLYNACLEKCRNIMAGSVPLGGVEEITALTTELFKFLNVDNLARIILEPTINQVTKNLAPSIRQQFFDVVEKPNFTGDKLVEVLNGYVLNADDRLTFENAVNEFAYGANGFAACALNSLLHDYISVEKYFEGKGYDDSVAEIKENHPNGEAVVQTIYSHTQIKSKNIVIKAILEALKVTGSKFIPSLLENLGEIGNLHHTEEISSLAREIQLIYQNLCYKNNFSDMATTGTSATVEEVKKWLNGPLSKRPDSVGWKVIHEYFFDKEIGSQCLDRYVAMHISAESGYIENTYNLPNMKCTINHFTLLGKPTSFNKIVLPGNKLIVVRLSVDSDNYGTCFTNPDFLACLKKNIAEYSKKDEIVNVSIFVKITDDNSIHHDASCLTEQEEKKVCYAHQSAIVDLPSELAKIAKINRVNTVLCLHDRPLPQLTIVEQVRLEKDRLPVNAYPVLSRLSSVRAYQQDDPESTFAKLFIRQQLIISVNKAADVKKRVSHAIISALDNACIAAQVAMRKRSKTGKEQHFTSNHVFVFISCPGLSEEVIASEEHLTFMKDCITEEVERHMKLLAKHRITEVEMVYESVDGHKRIVIRDETGVTPEVITKFGKDLERYPTVHIVDKKRFAARRVNTSYIYDFPMIFGMAAINSWKNAKSLDFTAYNNSVAALPLAMAEALQDERWRDFFEITELVFENGTLQHITDVETLAKRSKNAPNKCGMVAWLMTLFTPEKPQGHKLVLIGNDVTFQSGSFGTAEDDLFAAASAYSREHNLPRVNVSVNSGARIGLSNKIIKLLKVQLKNEQQPDQGYEYIYVDGHHKADIEGQLVYQEMSNGRLEIRAVIGAEHEKIGVENLQGSGLIAGETSRAYFEVPTYCYVTGRSVGIGAYTARLAHRIVQQKQSPLILTGYEALNTLLGKKVYTSNNQLGGPEVMFRNGVTHAVVDNDLEGIAKILKWISYLPSENTSFPFFNKYGNDIDTRDVRLPIGGGDEKQYDVRQLIDSNNIHDQSGICDTKSFDEICGDWAKSIVAGRARLCGVPIGVVASEFRNFPTTVPADPALEGSQTQNLQRAGQVWYPDSAFKTAEAINDLNKENLPLLIIASLRGFSGGQKDMYDMVLKFGAQIVDALAVYNRPVIVYIPEAGELRGGAWAVLDSKIRPEFIHLVADEKSRGGILEPNAVVGIKFRKPVMADMMKRCDETYSKLSADPSTREEAEERYAELSKVYRNAAVEFADAHDRWQRMKAVGAVDHVTSLKNSRRLFSALIRNELAKVGMAEMNSNAPRINKPCLASSMTWVETNLKSFVDANSTMDEQFAQIENYYKKQFPSDLVSAVSEDNKRHQEELRNFMSKFAQ